MSEANASGSQKITDYRSPFVETLETNSYWNILCAFKI